MRRALRFARAAGGLVVVAVVLATAALAAPGASERVAREGGTLRVGIDANVFTTIDPALVRTPAAAALLDPGCGSLVDYPAKPPPEGARLRPELAESEPIVSRNGRTYTFSVRGDARFSDGARVTARAFLRAVQRFLDPAMNAGGDDIATLIVGGEDVRAGRGTTPRGVVARGRTLTVQLTKRDHFFLEWIAQLCAVPPSLTADPEGAKAPLPSPAPYYVSEYVPEERLVLERNRFYRGTRPHHVDRIAAVLEADPNAIIDDVATGRLDYALAPGPVAARAGELSRRYGVNKSRFFVRPAGFLRMFVLNASRPLFRNNPKLRQAVNFAVDRRALTRELGPLASAVTDQYLSPSQPGFVDARVYPLRGPDLARARALARGRTRSRMAVLYTSDAPVDVAEAQVLQRNLKAIGIAVEIRQIPGTLLFDKLAAERHLFDIGRIALGHSPDPSWFSRIFDGRTIGDSGNSNFSYFNSPKYNRLFDEASRLRGEERDRAYGALDVQISRDAAPAIPLSNLNIPTFVSARVGCIVLNPTLVLTAACLK